MTTRYIVVKVNNWNGEAPKAVAEALATIGMDADVSVSMLDRPLAAKLIHPLSDAFRVRPPDPKPLKYVVTRV